MSETETFEQLKKLIVEMLDVDESKVVPKASFADDFEADSLDFIELLQWKTLSRSKSPMRTRRTCRLSRTLLTISSRKPKE